LRKLELGREDFLTAVRRVVPVRDNNHAVKLIKAAADDLCRAALAPATAAERGAAARRRNGGSQRPEGRSLNSRYLVDVPAYRARLALSSDERANQAGVGRQESDRTRMIMPMVIGTHYGRLLQTMSCGH
jgi:hypothetical protein